MNPEEGNLRAQIMDRFGLRVIVNGLNAPQERLEAYRRVCAYRENPRGFLAQYADETAVAAQEIVRAREILHQVQIPEALQRVGVQLIQTLNITSLRAEITLFEAARAMAAADNRLIVERADFEQVAPLALRLRRSVFMGNFLEQQALEEAEISETLARF
jgi:magnesium chelatase subunit I